MELLCQPFNHPAALQIRESLRVFRQQHAHLLDFVQRLIRALLGAGIRAHHGKPGMDIVNIRYDARKECIFLKPSLFCQDTRRFPAFMPCKYLILVCIRPPHKQRLEYPPVCGYYVSQLLHIPTGKFPVLVRAPGQLLIMQGTDFRRPRFLFPLYTLLC